MGEYNYYLYECLGCGFRKFAGYYYDSGDCEDGYSFGSWSNIPSRVRTDEQSVCSRCGKEGFKEAGRPFSEEKCRQWVNAMPPMPESGETGG